MAHSVTWDATFDAQPDDTDSISAGADEIRDFKDGIRERLDLEHYFDMAGTNNWHGVHTPPVASKTTTYVLLYSDEIVLCSASGGAFTVTLPAVAAIPTGKRYFIKKTDTSANAVTVDGDGSETIDGATSVLLSHQYNFIEVVNSGTSWIIVNGVYLGAAIAWAAAGGTEWAEIVATYYWKDNEGVVHLSGRIQAGATATTIPFPTALPVGYRPALAVMFICGIIGVTGLPATFAIGTGGATTSGTAVSGSIYCLDGITFRAA